MASAMFTGISVNMPQCFWTPRCPMHPLWWSSHPGSTEWQPATWAKTRWWWKQPAGWVTAHAFKGISEPHTFVLTWVPSLALGSLNLFFSDSNCLLLLFMCVCVYVCVHACARTRFSNLPFLFEAPASVCVSVWPSWLGSPIKKSESSSWPPLSLVTRLSLLCALHHAGLFCQ